MILPFTLALSVLSLTVNAYPRAQTPFTTPRTKKLSFELRQSHSTFFDDSLASSHPRILFRNEHPSAGLAPSHSVSTTPIVVSRPASPQAFQAARLHSLRHGQSEVLEWDDIPVLAPDLTDRTTILELAKMTGNAYAQPGRSNWYDLDPEWNTSFPIGWEPDDDGFRGHVFATTDNSTVVLSIKGTSLWSMNGPTAKKDKLNDNLLFSCCCARVDWSWSWEKVCGCWAGGLKCDNTCLSKSLIEDSLFYSVGVNLYNNLTYIYPDADIWLVGHSLGGAIASLLSATFAVPTVAFEAPGERLAATRLHLPQSPTLVPVTHIYHNADPIPLGTCTGIRSLCAKGGYAMETHCHLGKSIVYDAVSQLGLSVALANHRIAVLIKKVLAEDWEPPEAQEEVACVDCFKWDFGEYIPQIQQASTLPVNSSF